MASKRPGDDSSNPAGAGKKKQTQPQAQAASSVSGAVAVPAPRLSAAAASCSATPLLARLLADCDTGSASPLLERLLADCDSSLEDAFARLTVSLRQPLLGLLCDGEGNQLFSPLLMAKSLGVLWRAAGIDPPKGTFNQVNDLIDQSTRDRPNDQSNISEVSEVVLHADCYTRDLTGNNFNHSDQFFIDSSLQIQQWFKVAQVVRVNFSGDRETTLRRINELPDKCRVNWSVNADVDSAKITRNTRLLLLNTCYFTGNWAFAVDPQNTREGLFHLSSSVEVRTPMMHMDSVLVRHVFNEDEAVSICALPYATQTGHRCEMIVMLPGTKSPDASKDLNDFLGRLTLRPKLLTQLLESLDNPTNQVIVEKLVLPRFKLAHTTELKELLQKLGVKDIFDEKNANLTGLSSSKGLFLSNVLHRTLLDVCEGTRGLTSSASASLGGRQYGTRQSFVCDRPFLFLIREKMDDVKGPDDGGKPSIVYFVGAYRKPVA